MWTKILPLLFLASVADAQYTISTFAGGGPGVGQSVATYGLVEPYAVAVDSAGNLYISLPFWNQVWVVNSSGTVTQVVGDGACGFSGDNGPAASAQLCGPEGVAVDSSGNLYIADYGNSRIRKVSGGIITTVAGNGTSGSGGDGGSATSAELYYPEGVAVDSSGNLYIADTTNNRIRKVSAGIIATVVGNGTQGFSGDGGSATSAELAYPSGVAVDSSGNLYIADASNDRIRKVSLGIITTVAGNGTVGFSGDGGNATSAEFNYPSGIAVDGSGNLYIADNSRIRRVSGGIIATVAGNGAAGFSGDGGSATSAELYEPGGVTVDSSGNLYIADTHNNRIRKVSGGIITTAAGNALASGGDGGPATNAEIASPEGSAADSSGNLFVADFDDCVVRKVASGTGIISTVAGNGTCGYGGDGGSATSAQLEDPTGVAVDSSGNLYVADFYNSRIRKVSGGIITTVAGNGIQGYSGDGGSAISAELYYPSGVAVDNSGNLYIADYGNNTIRKVSGGIITTIAGNGTQGYAGDGVSATSAELNAPSGIALDSSGNLYIADFYNGRIRKVSGGIITTVAGGGTSGLGDGGSATSAELSLPYGVAVDSSGNLYIADSYNHRIRKVSGGIITTVAGDGTEGFSGDGGSATSAELGRPFGVTVDSSGSLYIADIDNNRIRKLTPIGAIGVTVTVSGAVQNGVAINVTGTTITSCTTSGGSCALGLSPGGTYTLTPSLAGYIFSPALTTLPNLSVSQTVSFFSGTQAYTVTANVSGSVQNGVIISVTGSTTTSCTTSGSGSCSLTLIGGGNYTLTPVLSGYIFSPASTTFSNLSANQTANFTAATQTYTVTGTVSGTVWSGVTINVNGTTSAQATTGSTGTYSIPLLPGGSYTISAALAGYTFTPATYTFSNLTANQTANFTEAVDSPLDFYPVSPPCRIADTRAGAGFTGQYGPPTLAGGATRVFGILSSTCAASIPSSVAAYSLNFTAIPPAAGPAANLTTWPVGQPQPNASTLNYSSFVVANAAMVPAGTGGAIDVFVSYPADMVIDIDGYFAPPQASGLEFFPVTPCRIADTRTGAGFTGQYGPPSLGGGATRQFYIPTCGIPATASAYSLNFAAVPPGGGSEANLTAWPGTQGMPNVSSLNFYSNVIAGAAIVPAAPTGEMNVYVSASTNILIDTNGYFAPAQSSGYHFYPLPPCRIADTRSGAGFTGQFGPPTMATGQTRTFTLPQSSCEIPATAAAYSLNFTVIPPSTGQEANLTTWPAGAGMPNVSTLNYYGGVLANAAIVPAGTSGAINVYVADTTDLVIDIDGYFAP